MKGDATVENKILKHLSLLSPIPQSVNNARNIQLFKNIREIDRILKRRIQQIQIIRAREEKKLLVVENAFKLAYTEYRKLIEIRRGK